MAANKLALFCLVDGESTAFEVEIDRNASISRFKDAIFDKIDNTGFKAKDLVLWRVTIPFDENAEDEPILLDGLNVKTKLGNPRTRLSELFPTPESLDDNTYIIVQPPRAAPSTSATTPLLSISEVLNRPLPPLSWRSNNPGPSSTTHSAYSRTPIEVREWTEFATQAAAQILPTNRTLRSEDYVFRTNLAASNEDSVGSALDTNVYNLLNSLQTTAWIGTRSEIGGVLGEPDRVCYIQLSQELRIVMEIKTTRALSCNNLVTKYLEDMALIADGYAPANPTWRQVHQVFGYMCHNNLRYGIFTTYDDTWFMTREAGRLWISPSIRHNSTQPSVLKCYRYLMELADQGFTSPSPAPSPRPSPPPSPPGDDSNDDPKDGSHQGRKKQTRKQDQQRPGIVTRSRNKVQQIFRKLPNGFTVSVGKLSLHEFDIQELLGEGRTGRVFRATWKGESVALKVCDLYKHPEYEDEILSEVAAYKALEDLQGVCIPHFKIAGYDGGLFSIAMEIAGSPMEVDKLSSQERLKIADGLLLIHQHGIMHNDIRVYNILVCNGDGFQVHFIDFAQSRRTSDKRELRKEMVQLKSLLKIG